MFSWDCCRLCLSNSNLNPLSSGTEENYIEMVFNVTGVKITSDDPLPKQICMECRKFIENYIKFKDKCQETQKKLFDELENPKIGFKIETSYDNTQNGFVYPEIEIIEQEKGKQINDLFPTDNDKHLHLYKNSTQLFTEEIYSKQMHKQNFIETDSIAFIQTADEETPKLLIETKKTKVKLKTKIKNEKTKKKQLKMPLKNKLNDKIIEKNAPSELANYEIKNGVKEKVKCEKCDKVLSSKSTLLSHMKIHKGFDVVCEHCGQKFLTKRRLLMHCKAKHGYEKTDKCSYCDYRGCNSEQVKIHERLHTGERPFVCKDCDASFLRTSCYLQHIAIHLPEKTVQCAQCPARFKSVTLMKIHANKHRMAQFSFKCYVCDSIFARRRNVLRHLRRIHAVSEPTQNIERVAK